MAEASACFGPGRSALDNWAATPGHRKRETAPVPPRPHVPAWVEVENRIHQRVGALGMLHRFAKTALAAVVYPVREQDQRLATLLRPHRIARGLAHGVIELGADQNMLSWRFGFVRIAFRQVGGLERGLQFL